MVCFFFFTRSELIRCCLSMSIRGWMAPPSATPQSSERALKIRLWYPCVWNDSVVPSEFHCNFTRHDATEAFNIPKTKQFSLILHTFNIIPDLLVISKYTKRFRRPYLYSSVGAPSQRAMRQTYQWNNSTHPIFHKVVVAIDGFWKKVKSLYISMA